MMPSATAVEEALSVLDQELQRILETRITRQELQKAIKQAKALFAYSSESVTNQGFWMGFSEMFADLKWFDTYLDQLAQVTPTQVRQVAQRYLRRSNRVVGMYRHIPDGRHA